MDQVLPSNRLLASLTPEDAVALAPHLEPVDLVQGTVLFDIDDTIERVYFPSTGVVSLVVGLMSGQVIETGMIGRDSLVGGAAGLDGKVAPYRAMVQIAGSASVMAAEHLQRLVERSSAFRMTLIHHEQLILVQAQQAAACNAAHALEARLARWLLRCRDLMASDDLALTQEFVGEMLGVQRSSVSIVAATLQQAGMIRYRRGHIRILDPVNLSDAACECYQAIKVHSQRLLGQVSV